MIKLDTQNLTNIEPKNELISSYLEKIHARKQGFYEILDDQDNLEKIKAFTAANKHWEHIVLLGIGGSSLGPICLQQALTHLYKSPKLQVLDNIDPVMISEIEDIIDYAKTLFIVVTKSGTTPETLSQYYYFRKQAETKGLNISEHFVFVTDPKKGILREIANEEGITAFDIPENVGGRFSVLTAVGLLPAALLNLDIDKLMSGARSARALFLSPDPAANLPFKLANIQYELSKQGKIMTVMFPYAQKLIRLADWYRQLLAESIGKKLDNKGNIVFAGLTPINALGVTDQHSQSQLYNEGPNDKFFIFLEVDDHGPELKIPVYGDGKLSFGQLLEIEKRATEESLTKNDRPNITIKLDSVSEESLGELFLLFEGSIAFLGEFFNINAFDQPGVELSKILTKQYVAEL
ncbi:glucose-6-phosphate isomerase [Candidatus Peregrinibacteria bacterium]|nr:glucose-6-phosphate isomerase [Candidatus Peregrinibacteria bacterium]